MWLVRFAEVQRPIDKTCHYTIRKHSQPDEPFWRPDPFEGLQLLTELDVVQCVCIQ